MVLAGEIEVKGTIDDSELQAGLTRIEGKLDNIEAKVQSSSGSFNILSQSTGKVAKDLITIGTAGVTALLAFASSAPAVAGEMANIKNSMREIKFELGETFKPIFQDVAADLQDLSGALQGNLDSIYNLIPEGSMMAIGAAIGFSLMGPAGLFVGAALGYAAGNLGEQAFDANFDKVKSTLGEFEDEQERIAPFVEAGVFTPGQGNIVAIGSTFANFIKDFFDKILGTDTEMEIEGGFIP